ncbi:pancreatic triacylglycerol lipase-like isoform X1 [Trichoplusia ni]|uniref:Pancreatic triacylglycerol lipase-like isoform X1 n=2 Tax=Trichoplusia ni TaxID=7111 RepID=A0A7E5VDJ8_TRINI|nr:pancreatic triacylglycerol lipase-like isoform X1 [Trichoplusia ni]
MERFCGSVFIISVLFVLNVHESVGRTWITTTDELENHINPEDLLEFINIHQNVTTNADYTAPTEAGYAELMEPVTALPVPGSVECFGLGSLTSTIMRLFQMKPDSANAVNTHFYFSSRTMLNRTQVFPGSQFGLEWVDFKANRKTVLIVHGFMSHSNASWVHDMTRAFLAWGDVNVIAVDWSGGGNTWKYWRAVANTRRVGSDVVTFMRQLIAATGARIKDFHFVGHSLGAHIASYASFHLGKVARITGLDPAQPCFRTSDSTERLDATDADFVDIIHTNGRLLSRIGFGFPDPTGHADFYPNGGMKQPGCYNNTKSLWAKLLPFSPTKLQQAICSHGRAYLLFTESLISNNCTFRGHKWDLTYEGVNASLKSICDRSGSCSEMGIRAVGGSDTPRARGPYFVLTTDKEPYCATEWQLLHPQPDLLRDLRQGFLLDRSQNSPTTVAPNTGAYADPMARDEPTTTTTQQPWYKRWFG